MLMADDGKSQAEIAKMPGCSPVTVRHSTLVASSGKAHHWKDSAIGRPKEADTAYLERLKELVSQTPKSVKIPNQEYTYVRHRWTASLLSQHLRTELGVEISPRHINRLLNQMGLSLRVKNESSEQPSLQIAVDGHIEVWHRFKPASQPFF